MAKRKTIKECNKELALQVLKLHIYGLKLRAMPVSAQKEKIKKTLGCARFTKNFYLAERMEGYRGTGETLSVA
ncbi:helix-turn-helix domain-containing protein [Domibacillus sp. 8LH]|uniref:helix-turn-helix domain-containing protein n=1 Tax=Domibacillus sp. 8LH TaxID=3073900 RepID=UPI003178C679